MSLNPRRRSFLKFTAVAGSGMMTGNLRGNRQFSSRTVRERRLDFGGSETIQASAQGDDGFVLAGSLLDTDDDHTGRRPLLVGVDETGESRWNRAPVLDGSNHVVSASATADDGVLIGGRVETDDEPEAVVHKFGRDRDVQWSTRLREHGNATLDGAHVSEVGSGTYVARWREEPAERPPVSYLAAFDVDGTERWRTELDAALDHAIVDGGVVVATGQFVGVTVDGETSWTVDPPGPVRALAGTADGGFVAAGVDDESDQVVVVRYDAERQRRWQARFDVTQGDDATRRQVRVQDISGTSEGGVVLALTARADRQGSQSTTGLLRVDRDGELGWRSTDIGSTDRVAVSTVQSVGSGRHLLAGTYVADGQEGDDGWLAVLDESAANRPTTTSSGATSTGQNAQPSRTTAAETATTDSRSAGSAGWTSVGLPGFTLSVGAAGVVGSVLVLLARRRDD